MRRPRVMIVGAAVATASGSAWGDVLYQSTFESGPVDPVWSANTHFEQLVPFTRYIGRYSGEESVVLALPAPAAAALGPGQSYLYTLTFDFYALDSWDGYEPNFGPDWFRVYANGSIVFDETFANVHNLQSFRPPDVGPAPMGYAAAPDSIYRDIAVPFQAPGATTLSLKFRGQVLQGMADESWGIDNVRVAYQVVPAPGPLALLGLAGLVVARRRR